MDRSSRGRPSASSTPGVESGFAKIIRHGTLPANYWWEVKDKKGLRYLYGGVPETGQDPGAILTDGAGHVFTWGLREIRDLPGNAVVYSSAKVSDPGVQGGTVTGFDLYPKTARYTSTSSTEGRYLVTFVRPPGFSCLASLVCRRRGAQDADAGAESQHICRA